MGPLVMKVVAGRELGCTRHQHTLKSSFVVTTSLGRLRDREGLQVCQKPKLFPTALRRSRCSLRMQERRGDSEIDESADDDDRLQLELRLKVRELYGGRENVAIVTEGLDDTVEFRVRQGPGGVDYTSYRAAWFTVGGILVSALLSMGLFFYLVKTGAVHDSTRTRVRHEMPSYGTRTYIDPYGLLQEDTPVIQ
jgi:hypothetical protein